MMTRLWQDMRTLEAALGKDEAARPTVDAESLANRALKPLVSRVRGMLVQNYRQSEIGKRAAQRRKDAKEGRRSRPADKRGALDLEGAIAGAVVWARVIDGELILRYGLAPGLPNRVYAAAGALEYGGIRGASTLGVGAKRRQKVKRQTLAKNGNKNQKLNAGVSVSRAYHFFHLTDSQAQEIGKRLIAIMEES